MRLLKTGSMPVTVRSASTTAVRNSGTCVGRPVDHEQPPHERHCRDSGTVVSHDSACARTPGQAPSQRATAVTSCRPEAEDTHRVALRRRLHMPLQAAQQVLAR